MSPCADVVEPPRAALDQRDWRRRVARAFGRAAPGYAERADAQRVMGEALWRRLPAQAERILDLGCGPGHWSARLARHYHGDRPANRATGRASPGVIGLDLAPGMLASARQVHGEAARWLCADAACLPLADACLDLVFSNLAIQWCPDPFAVLGELHRVLAPGGRALINTLGPGTLEEVGQAWSRPGRPAALLAFADATTLGNAARQAGFGHVDLEAVHERFHYPDLAAVMASIKGVGAQASRPGARLTRRDLVRARTRFERLREPAGLPVTYRRLTLTLSK